MVTIFAERISPRLEYITSHILGTVLSCPFELTADKNYFIGREGACINYSHIPFNKGIQIIPQGILGQTGTRPIADLKESTWDGLFCFFGNNQGGIPFDLLGASFYLLTRYEEYNSTHLDEHQRFDYKHSIQYRNGILELPIIDVWAHKLLEILQQQNKGAIFSEHPHFRILSTFDIDYPYQFRNKGFSKNVAGLIRDLIKKDKTSTRQRIRTCLHREEDPYFKAIEWIDAFHNKYSRDYKLFLLFARYGQYGRQTIYPLRRFHSYVKGIIQEGKNKKIGLHPSYSSFDKEKQIAGEKTLFSKKIGSQADITRQHFLQLQIPTTYRILDRLGFREDYSLGYSHQPGFRSGTCFPYPFYDLGNEAISQKLTLYPTIVMDTTLISHLGMNPEEALKKLKTLAKACKEVEGNFVMLWHNSNLTGDPTVNPWINVFIESFQYALSLENDTFAEI